MRQLPVSSTMTQMQTLHIGMEDLVRRYKLDQISTENSEYPLQWEELNQRFDSDRLNKLLNKMRREEIIAKIQISESESPPEQSNQPLSAVREEKKESGYDFALLLEAALKLSDADRFRLVLWMVYLGYWEGILRLNQSNEFNMSQIVNMQNSSGRSLLHWSVCLNFMDVTRALLAVGADVNIQDKDGHTPLYEAVDRCSSEKLSQEILKKWIDLLVSAGADLNIKNSRGLYLLHECAYLDWPEAMQILIAEGADINVKDSEGDTPLSVARKLACYSLQAARSVAILEEAASRRET
jgi:hypothetical protein